MRYLKEEDFYQRYKVSPEGLVLWLDQSDGRSYGTVSQWNDLSGQGNHATQGVGANQPTIVGELGLAGSTRLFDGVNDYASFTDSGFPSGSSPRTLSFWFRQIAAQPSTLFIYGTEIGAQRCSIGFAAGGADISVGISGHAWGFLHPKDDLWHNLVIVYPFGETMSDKWLMYLDSILQSGSTVAGIPLTLNTTLTGSGRISGDLGGAGLYGGQVSHIFLSTRGLLAAEVQRMYLVDAPRHGGL